jgi:hypothetical protein
MKKVIAVICCAGFGVLVGIWPWVVNYPMPEWAEWLIVIDKLPIFVGQVLIGITGIGVFAAMWPKREPSSV